MTCQEVRGLLMTYLDSELDARSTAEVGEHLAACEGCRGRFAVEEKLERQAKTILTQEPMPPEVWDRLQGRLRRGPRRVWRWVAVAASLLIVVGLAFRIWHRDQVESSVLFDRMISMHQDFLANRIRPEVEAGTPEPLEKFLKGHVSGRFSVPRGGTLKGHAISLIGARREVLQGSPAADILLTCCGFPTSIFVMDRKSFEDDPAIHQALARKAELTQSGPEGLKVKATVRGDLAVCVVSAHDTPVMEAVQALAEAILSYPTLLAEAP